MGDAALARTSGALAGLAGFVLGVHAAVESLQPAGCIGDTCSIRPMRDTPAVVNVLFGVGGALLVAVVLALGLLLRRRGMLGRVGAGGWAPPRPWPAPAPWNPLCDVARRDDRDPPS